MNQYLFSELKEGMSCEFEYEVTAENQKKFYEITGDCNPFHSDACYANSVTKENKGVVVYGMLTASLVSTMAGVFLPGKYCLLQSVESIFVSSVFINDKLKVKGVIQEVDSTFKRVKVKVVIVNQEMKKVYRGYYIAGVLQ